jgi:hypothetical protein
MRHSKAVFTKARRSPNVVSSVREALTGAQSASPLWLDYKSRPNGVQQDRMAFQSDERRRYPPIAGP